MKKCPICQSLAFDDAKQCFGCLHLFGEDDRPLPEHQARTPDGPPAFIIQIKPERERSGQTSWTCTVDLVPE